jgi:hypothetical protein
MVIYGGIQFIARRKEEGKEGKEVLVIAKGGFQRLRMSTLAIWRRL